MYRKFSAGELKTHIGLEPSYTVDGFIEYGTYQSYPYDVLRDKLAGFDSEVTFRELPSFLSPILHFTVNGKNYWFVTAYGGALLSEYVHLACLFGSKANIVLGSCGGLFESARSRDLIVPPSCHGNESTTRAYSSAADNLHHADDHLRQLLKRAIPDRHKVWEGPTVTHQAMLGETWDDVVRWSNDGFYGVEMEAATVIAASRHFNVPAAAVLMIGDNLVREESVLDINYENARDKRRAVTGDIFAAALQVVTSL